MVGIPDQLRAEIDVATRTNRPGNRYYADDSEIRDELRTAEFHLRHVVMPEKHSAIYVATTGIGPEPATPFDDRLVAAEALGRS